MHNQQQQGCTELQQEHLIQQNQLLQHQIANITNTNKPIQHQEHSITHLWFSGKSQELAYFLDNIPDHCFATEPRRINLVSLNLRDQSNQPTAAKNLVYQLPAMQWQRKRPGAYRLGIRTPLVPDTQTKLMRTLLLCTLHPVWGQGWGMKNWVQVWVIQARLGMGDLWCWDSSLVAWVAIIHLSESSKDQTILGWVGTRIRIDKDDDVTHMGSNRRPQQEWWDW